MTRDDRNLPFFVHLDARLALRQTSTQLLTTLNLHLQLALQSDVLLPYLSLFLRVTLHRLFVYNESNRNKQIHIAVGVPTF